MNEVTKSPSVVNIQRFPQREEEEKKKIKKETGHWNYSPYLFEDVSSEEDNVTEVKFKHDNPPRTDTPDLTGVQKRENESNAKKLYEG